MAILWEKTVTGNSTHGLLVTEPGLASSPQLLGRPMLLDDTASTKSESGKCGCRQQCMGRTAIIVQKQASLNCIVSNKKNNDNNNNNKKKRNKSLGTGQSRLNSTSGVH